MLSKWWTTTRRRVTSWSARSISSNRDVLGLSERDEAGPGGGRGRRLVLTGNYAEAVSQYGASVTLHPDYARLRRAYGEALLQSAVRDGLS